MTPLPSAASAEGAGALQRLGRRQAGYAEGGALAAHMPGWQVTGWGLLAALPATLLLTGLGLATEPVRLSTHAVAGLAYMAVSQFGGMLIWYRGMAVIGVPRASQLQLAQPLLSLVWSALLLGEHMPPVAPAAAIAVAACIVVTQRVPAVAATPLPSSSRPLALRGSDRTERPVRGARRQSGACSLSRAAAGSQ
jgi:drug/metabolite transporter (DMT)-like permease